MHGLMLEAFLPASRSIPEMLLGDCLSKEHVDLGLCRWSYCKRTALFTTAKRYKLALRVAPGFKTILCGFETLGDSEQAFL